MADLDDFFAKKDKKKLKGKKFDNLDEIGKRLEKSEKKLEKLQKVEQPSLDHEVQLPNEATKPEIAPKEEEEWKDFKVEQEKDLTDLKISNLQIEDDDDGGYGGGGSDEDGEGGGAGGEKQAWSKSNMENQEKPQTIAIIEEIVVKPAPASKLDADGKSSYVPPHMRNSTPSALPKKTSYRKPRVAPDINNEMAFPSLSNIQDPKPGGAWGRRKPGDDRGFENVKHGSTKSFSDEAQGPKLSMANRFDALSDNS